MHLTPRRLLGFGLLFIPLFLLFLALYLVVLPLYEPLVLEAANAATRRLTPATHVEPRAHGGWQLFSFTPEHGQRALRKWSPTTAHLVYLNLVILPALLLATPIPFLARLKLLALAVPLVFAGHVLTVVVVMRGTLCLREAPGTFHCLWALRLAYTSGQVSAAALWLLLTWRYWFSTPGRGNVARSSREPDTGLS